MNIFEKLRTDHEGVKDLMLRIEQSEDAGRHRSTLFQQMKRELLAHAKAEEEIFYAELEGEAELADRIAEARAEHAQIEQLCESLESLAPDDDRWLERFRELKELVDDHVEDEEGEIFELARGVIEGAEADTLGGRMETREDELRPQI